MSLVSGSIANSPRMRNPFLSVASLNGGEASQTPRRQQLSSIYNPNMTMQSNALGGLNQQNQNENAL